MAVIVEITTRPLRRPGILSHRHREILTPYCFLAPSFVALGVVFFYPMVQAVSISLRSNGLSPTSHFVGLDNFVAIARSDWLIGSLITSFLWSIFSVVAVCALSLGTAMMLNRPLRLRAVIRAFYIIPWAMPYVAAALVWGWMFDYEFGVLNYLLRVTGLLSAKVGFLIGCPAAFLSLSAVSVWKLFPFGTVMLLAGLQTIPKEQYEAAKVDGAGPVAAFRYVTLPGLRNVLVMLALLITIWSFGRTFTIIFLLTQGGPAGCTETIVVRSYLEAFKFYRVGIASATGIIVLLISLALSLIYLRILRQKQA